MRAVACCLREYAPAERRHEVCLAGSLGDVAIAVVTSSAGSWIGLDAEAPAVRAAYDALIRAARRTLPSPAVAVANAFRAASRALDPLPRDDNFDCDHTTAMCAALATPYATIIGALGSVGAARFEGERAVERTATYSLRDKLLADGATPAQLDANHINFASIYLECVMPLRTADRPAPRLHEWPALAPGHRLLLAPHEHLDAALARPPSPGLSGERWLAEALTSDARRDPGRHHEFSDRVGAVIEG
ncbi:MAG: hypothetical protein KC636_05170 [Myxococcales bacterium]|nr:hypothetical protein [Myxococcales bacterium]